jgi:Na+/proline symporter
MVQFAIFLQLGVALACYYERFAPGTVFENNDYVFATFVVRELPFNIGVIGLLLAAVFAAAMSTLSSSLNSSASAAVNDLYVPLRSTKPTTKHLLRMSRWLTIVFGIVQIAIGIAAGICIAQGIFPDSVVANALAIASFAAGLLLGLFFLGVFTLRVDQTAALVGLIVGLVTLLAAKFVAPEFGVVIAWPWFALIGAAATFSVGYVTSFLTHGGGPTKDNVKKSPVT